MSCILIRVEDNAFSLYDLYGHTLGHEPLPQGSWNLQFARPFLGHLCYIHVHVLTNSLSEPCPRVEKKIFYEKHQFYTFYSKITSPCGWGSWNLQFPVSFPYRCYIPNVVKISLVVLEKKMLTDNARRWMPTNSNSPEWLSWPKNCFNTSLIMFQN